MSARWQWIVGPVPVGAVCEGCRKRLYGEHLVKWTNGSTWHLGCLLDSLAAEPAVSAPVAKEPEYGIVMPKGWGVSP
jgi:hypothetical protein